MKLPSPFRHWCQEKWYEHQEEIAAYMAGYNETPFAQKEW